MAKPKEKAPGDFRQPGAGPERFIKARTFSPMELPAREAVEVYVSDSGNVCIKQPLWPDDDQVVVIHPDDAPRVAQFIMQAERQARRQKS